MQRVFKKDVHRDRDNRGGCVVEHSMFVVSTKEVGVEGVVVVGKSLCVVVGKGVLCGEETVVVGTVVAGLWETCMCCLVVDSNMFVGV